jgi:hypothetical protein
VNDVFHVQELYKNGEKPSTALSALSARGADQSSGSYRLKIYNYMIFQIIMRSNFHAPDGMKKKSVIDVRSMYRLSLASMVCAGGLEESLLTERGDGRFVGEWHNRQCGRLLVLIVNTTTRAMGHQVTKHQVTKGHHQGSGLPLHLCYDRDSLISALRPHDASTICATGDLTLLL